MARGCQTGDIMPSGSPEKLGEPIMHTRPPIQSLGTLADLHKVYLTDSSLTWNPLFHAKKAG